MADYSNFEQIILSSLDANKEEEIVIKENENEKNNYFLKEAQEKLVTYDGKQQMSIFPLMHRSSTALNHDHPKDILGVWLVDNYLITLNNEGELR